MNTFEGFKMNQIYKFENGFSMRSRSQPLIILDIIIAERDKKPKELVIKFKEWVDNQPRKLYNV